MCFEKTRIPLFSDLTIDLMFFFGMKKKGPAHGKHVFGTLSRSLSWAKIRIEISFL